MRMEVVLGLAVGLLLLAGCLGPTDEAEEVEELGEEGGNATVVPDEGQATIALVDTGINPYHEVYRDNDTLRQQHPSTYIEDYPEDARRLNLTLDAESWDEAVEADCQGEWAEVERGELYWVPGTKIVGAVAVGGGDPLDCEDPRNSSATRILDVRGHGTMVSSRAAADGYGACPDCNVVAVHQVGVRGTEWAAEQSDWIDVQSNSWAMLGFWLPNRDLPTPTGSHYNPSYVERMETAAQEHATFFASGNGLLNHLGGVGHPTTLDPGSTPNVISVGGHDSGHVIAWPGFPPDVVSNSCNGWAAYNKNMTKSSATRAGGTSGASPYAAGKAAAVLQHARTILDDPSSGMEEGVAANGTAPEDLGGPLGDGTLTQDELERLVKTTADPRPEREPVDGPPCGGTGLYTTTPVVWKDVPEAYPGYVHLGYGAVNNASTEVASSVLEGEATMPDRTQTDLFFEAEGVAREAMHEVWTTDVLEDLETPADMEDVPRKETVDPVEEKEG